MSLGIAATSAAAAFAAAPTDPITPPPVDLGLVMPVLIVLGGACIGVLLEAFLPRAARYGSQVTLAVVGAGRRRWPGPSSPGRAPVRRDVRRRGRGRRGDLRDVGRAAGAGPAVGAADGRSGVRAGRRVRPQAAATGRLRPRPELAARVAAPMQTEVFPLALFAVGGMMVFPAASDLVTLFVALEVLSLPLYLMCGLARRRRLISQESAVKYFLLGAFTSAIFLYGLALLYGYAGSTAFSAIATQARTGEGSDALLLGGMSLVVVGLLFKASVGPFHLWTPDVYQGAPTPITAFMAACTKVAAFAAMLRVCLAALEPMAWSWQPVVGDRRRRVDGDRLGHRHHPDRHEAHAGLLVGGARRVHPARRARDVRRAARRRRCSTCSPTAWRRSAPSPS